MIQVDQYLAATDVAKILERNGSLKVKAESITLMRIGLSDRIHIYYEGKSLCSIERLLKYKQWGQFKNLRDQATKDEFCSRCWSWCEESL